MFAPFGWKILCWGKMLTKVPGVYPLTRVFNAPPQEVVYTTLLMSTGLTFGTMSARFGLSHQVIDQAQYSYLVAAVIGFAVAPTLIADTFIPAPASAAARGRRSKSSHRIPTTATDRRTAMGGGQSKTGSACRSERVAKYNQLAGERAGVGGAVRFGR